MASKEEGSSYNTQRIDHIIREPQTKSNFHLHYGDLTDSLSLMNIIKKLILLKFII